MGYCAKGKQRRVSVFLTMLMVTRCPVKFMFQLLQNLDPESVHQGKWKLMVNAKV